MPEDAHALALRVAEALRPGDTVLLAGDLGTGKTTFAQYLIAALSEQAVEVTSPTFTLVQDYPPEQGWRFATLMTLGLYEPGDSPAVLAAEVLSECQALKDSPEGRYDGTMALLERSIRLGITSACLGLGEMNRPVAQAGGSRALPDGQGELFDPPSD
jgi:energy-coupling factor transporter ATP-binding protein EcfA2